jgi:hypothetical protein
LKLRFKRLDMRWRKLAHWYLPNPWRDLTPDKLAMADRGLSCNAPLDINREPMVKIFRNAHLRRIDVGPFIPAIEQAI